MPEMMAVGEGIQSDTPPIGDRRMISVSLDHEPRDATPIQTCELVRFDCRVETGHRDEVEERHTDPGLEQIEGRPNVEQPSTDPIPVSADERWFGLQAETPTTSIVQEPARRRRVESDDAVDGREPLCSTAPSHDRAEMTVIGERNAEPDRRATSGHRTMNPRAGKVTGNEGSDGEISLADHELERGTLITRGSDGPGRREGALDTTDVAGGQQRHGDSFRMMCCNEGASR